MSVTFPNVVYSGRFDFFNDQRCVAGPGLGTDVIGGRLNFDTRDGGFSRLFAGPAGAALLTQIVSSYALPIMAANATVPPGGGPATCETAIRIGPTGVAEPPLRRHPAMCP